MYYQDFINSKLFLENLINNNLENEKVIKELLSTYESIILKQLDFDIQWLKSDESIRNEWSKNQTKQFEANSIVTKTALENGRL